MRDKQHNGSRLPKFYAKLQILAIAIFFILVWIWYRQPETETKTSVVVTSSQTFKGNKVKNYLIDTPNCRIPDTEPFNDDVRPFYRRYEYVPCSTLEPLVYVKRVGHVNKLFINYTSSKLYTTRKFNCCYSPVKRRNLEDEPDTYVDFLGCIPFETNSTVNSDSIKVYCYGADNYYKIYENVYSLPSLAKAKNRTKVPNKNDTPLSVLFLGIDTMSRMNLMRTMPKTYNYLVENDWIDMKGYNKIGSNTFPNLMGILTGMNDSYGYEVCLPTVLGNLDKCDLIWYKYRKLGLITAYGEDEPVTSTFNFLKTGFVSPPTDVYLRPYIVAAETLKVVLKFRMDYCTGPVSSGERIFNAAKDFALDVRGYPSFGFFWTNSFSHEDMNFASSMDEKTEELLVYLEENSILENSFVIFLSDHGFRFGDFRLTYSGWLEERLPYIYFWVPKWFRNKFHDEYKNFLTNSERLTTPFDVYMTLQHLLVLFGYDHQQTPSSACPKCKSLFREADFDRSCEDAGVEQHWCTCSGHFHLDVSHPKAISASRFALEHIQSLTAREFPEESKKCFKFKLKRVVTAGISEKFAAKNVSYIFVIFETVPYALFEATVEVDECRVFSINGDITRVDYYGDNSKCTEEAVLKKYCYCKSFVNYIKHAFCELFSC